MTGTWDDLFESARERESVDVEAIREALERRRSSDESTE